MPEAHELSISILCSRHLCTILLSTFQVQELRQRRGRLVQEKDSLSTQLTSTHHTYNQLYQQVSTYHTYNQLYQQVSTYHTYNQLYQQVSQ